MFALFLFIYLVLYNLIKAVVWVAVVICKIAISIFFWLLRITIQIVLFIYRRLRKLAIWGWRQFMLRHRARHQQRMIP